MVAGSEPRGVVYAAQGADAMINRGPAATSMHPAIPGDIGASVTDAPLPACSPARLGGRLARTPTAHARSPHRGGRRKGGGDVPADLVSSRV